MLRRSVRGSDLPGRRALQCPVRKEVNGSVTGFSRLNVVSRLIIGFAALFAVTTSVSVYSMIKLNEFNKASAHMLELGERLIEHKERLSDALLSELSYEKKYAISKDPAFREGFVTAGKDFTKHLAGASAIADTLGSKEILDNIAKQHSRYRDLIEEEAKNSGSGGTRRPGWYRQEKEKTVEAMIEEIKNLELYIEDDTRNRIDGLAKAGTRALRTGLVMAASSLLIGILIAAGITLSITRPLSVIKRKTRKISSGNFEDPLTLSSPPEIGHLARALNLMCERLKETDRMKSDFFSLMAHELRTPLASMKGGIALLRRDVDGSHSQARGKVLAIMSEECNRLIEHVNSLLDLSKMEAGIIDFNFAPGDVKPIVQRAVSEIEPLYTARSITFEFHETGKTPSVRMDGERVLQVMRNLLGNAVKFTPDGGRIAVSLKTVAGGVEISVVDSGPGIPEEDRTAIFDKYRQSATQAYSGGTGTGLGLAIAKHVVDAHGGRIWVESELGRGSTFTVFLRG